MIAIGGGILLPDGKVPAHLEYALQLTGKREPRLCVLNTAAGDDPRWMLAMHERFAGHPARVRHLALFPMPNVPDPEDRRPGAELPGLQQLRGPRRAGPVIGVRA